MRVLKEPLVQFLLLGAALFALHGLIDSQRDEPDPAQRIVVSRGDVERLSLGFRTQWRRPPTSEELEGLVAADLRERVLYREALRLGLDKDDTIVRRRLAQKVEFLLQDALPPRTPTAAELEAYMNAHEVRYRVLSRVSFEHIYFSTSRRGADAERAALAALAQLRTGARGKPELLGDPSMLELHQRDQTEEQVRQLFGADFASTAMQLAQGTWEGPVRSPYGWHLLKIGERAAARLPPLAEIQSQVQHDWADEQRRANNDEALRKLMSRYEIVREDLSSGDAGSAHAAEIGR